MFLEEWGRVLNICINPLQTFLEEWGRVPNICINPLQTYPTCLPNIFDNKLSHNQVIFQGEQHSGPKKYSLRARTTGIIHHHHHTARETLQRQPLNPNRPMSFGEVMSEAERNVSSDNKRAKLSLKKKEPKSSLLSNVLKYGSKHPPALKVKWLGLKGCM